MRHIWPMMCFLTIQNAAHLFIHVHWVQIVLLTPSRPHPLYLSTRCSTCSMLHMYSSILLCALHGKLSDFIKVCKGTYQVFNILGLDQIWQIVRVNCQIVRVA